MEKKNNIEKVEIKYRSALPIWAAAAVFVLAALFVPMYRPLHYVLIALFAAAAGIVVRVVCPYHTEMIDAYADTGNADLDTVINELYAFAKKLAALEDTALAAAVASIRETIVKIAEDLKSDPDDLKQCRRLLSYYMPTVEKLAEKYLFLAGQDGAQKNAADAMRDIEGAFASIDVLLKRQLDALFENDALDISTDIEVLQAMLRRDGFDN